MVAVTVDHFNICSVRLKLAYNLTLMQVFSNANDIYLFSMIHVFSRVSLHGKLQSQKNLLRQTYITTALLKLGCSKDTHSPQIPPLIPPLNVAVCFSGKTFRDELLTHNSGTKQH